MTRNSSKTPKKLSKKDTKLLKELNDRIRNHKEEVIMYTLLAFEDTIYNTKYFKRYKNMEIKDLSEKEDNSYNFNPSCVKVYRVIEDIEKRNKKENGLYDKIYEYCWNKAKLRLEENANIHAEEI